MDFQEVISVENMRQSDAHTIAEHTSSAELMQRAAQGIFDAVKFEGRVAIVCGKGNNGGDGYALACILCNHAITPTIVRACEGFSKDGLYFYKTALSLGAEEESLEQIGNFAGYDIVVDCLLGTGFKGEVKGSIKAAIEQINLSNAYVVSADINSGINGDTGVGEYAVNSDLTVSIGAYKTGLFLNDAPYYIDLMVNADIGIHILEEEYKLIDYSLLHMFEGYGSCVMTNEEFFERYKYNPETCNIAQCIMDISRSERKTVVVKTDHSAVVADLKYVYFCADYVKK
jgi:NAD(P)H-hydrate epimerase